VFSTSKNLEDSSEARVLYLLYLDIIFERHIGRGSSVGIATSYGLDDRGFRVRGPIVSRNFCSPNRSDPL
jgi:hypothetical protein